MKIYYSTTSGILSGSLEIFTPKEVITDVTTKGVTSVKNRVKIQSIISIGVRDQFRLGGRGPGGALTFGKGRGVWPQNLKPYP